MTLRAPDGRLVASISLDLDNLWSYMKTYGDDTWTTFPTFIPAVVPRLLDLYESFGLQGTVFVVGQDAERDENAEAIAAISAAGHEIGSHSFNHEPWMHRHSLAQIDDELAQTEESLVRVTGVLPTGFRAPGYCVSPSLLQVLEQRGYAYDASSLPTWIGPFARAYYFRSAHLSASQRKTRSRLFGRAREGLRPVHPYRWKLGKNKLVELPVTTMPMLRVPMHFSYLIYLHQASPAAARAYFRACLALCVARGVGPSLLLHPLDLIDKSMAAQAAFFPGMGLPASEKRTVIDWALAEMTSRFAVVSAGQHATALAGTRLGLRRPEHD